MAALGGFAGAKIGRCALSAKQIAKFFVPAPGRGGAGRRAGRNLSAELFFLSAELFCLSAELFCRDREAPQRNCGERWSRDGTGPGAERGLGAGRGGLGAGGGGLGAGGYSS